MTTRMRAIAAAVLVAASLAVPTAAAAGAPALNWTACPFPDSPETLQCASIEVPVDYSRPDGPTATVTVNRLRATGSPSAHHRIRSLFFDPGGPGGSGTEAVYAEAVGEGYFSAATRGNFDLIGFDPRGVGLSSPVRCDPEPLNRKVSLFPENEAEFRSLVERNRELGESCRELTGPLLDHVDTVSAARDMEAVRAALGEGRLNYLGLSYGSQLGATYAELFPDRIRTMALDGALDHSQPPASLFADEAGAYEDSFGRFADWCAETASCALHGSDVRGFFTGLLVGADREPIPAPGCHGDCRASVTGEDIRLAVQGFVLFPRNRELLATALKNAADGDASMFSPMLAAGPSDAMVNGSAIAIECLDWPSPVRTFGDLKRLQRIGEAVAPTLGGASQSWTILAGCAGWPSPAVNPPKPIEVGRTPPILITNATHDPSTAYPWAVSMARQIPCAVLVTRDGDGHTSYLARGPSRTRDAIDEYLRTGRTPPPGTVYRE